MKENLIEVLTDRMKTRKAEKICREAEKRGLLNRADEAQRAVDELAEEIDDIHIAIGRLQ